ncbi:MAG TPA: glycosyltransferase family 39 protein [Verrucomicrobiae bacterium]|nr:glycosyltransferase family 39 protein [Verrucomicrobiae bacterium]
MNNQSDQHRTGFLSFRSSWLIVLAVLLFVSFVRLRLATTPLERDEGEYAYAGQLILHGIPPYELAYNMKLPGTYYAYAIGMAVFGQTIEGVHRMLLAVNLLTIVFVFLLGKKLFGTTAGLVSCAGYGLMSLSVLVQGLAAHANHFVILFAVPATLLLLEALERKEARFWFFSGVLYGLAFLMKQQGICFCAFAVFYLTGKAVVEKTVFSGAFVKTLLIFTVGAILPFAFVCLSCAVAGDFSRFIFWTFIYASWYATGVNLHTGFPYFLEHLRDSWPVSCAFWFIAVTGVSVAALSRCFNRNVVFALVFWLFSVLGMAIGFYFRRHYFILLLPAFAILIGYGVTVTTAALCEHKMLRIGKSVPFIVFLLACGWATIYQASFFFRLSSAEVCQNLYQGNPFMEAPVAGKFLYDHTTPDTRIAVFGSEPEIYFYARRRSAMGYIYTYSLMEPHPAASIMQREMSDEIETNHPEYLVAVRNELSWLPNRYSKLTIFDWFENYSKNNYRKIAVVGVSPNNKAVLIEKNLEHLPQFAEAPLEIYVRISNTNLSAAGNN